MQPRRDDLNVPTGGCSDTLPDVLPLGTGLGHREDNEVGDQESVGVQVAGHDVWILMRARDHDGAIGVDRRKRRSAAVEHDEVGVERRGDTRALGDVRDRDRSGQAATSAPAADRRHPDERGGLEMVRRSVPPGA